MNLAGVVDLEITSACRAGSCGFESRRLRLKKGIPVTLRAAADRFFRQTIACPDGQITHLGDCEIYRSRVCDCGLLRTLVYFIGREDPATVFPPFWREWRVHQCLLHELVADRITR